MNSFTIPWLLLQRSSVSRASYRFLESHWLLPSILSLVIDRDVVDQGQRSHIIVNVHNTVNYYHSSRVSADHHTRHSSTTTTAEVAAKDHDETDDEDTDDNESNSSMDTENQTSDSDQDSISSTPPASDDSDSD